MELLRLGDPAPDAVDSLRSWLEAAEPARLLIETSGSSGVPKRVVLSREAVLASAEAALTRLGGPGRWVLALPPAYIAGVQVIVRSLLAGHEPVLGLDEPAPGDGPLYTSLVATQLHRLLETDPGQLARFDTILLGGGPVDPELRGRAEAAGARVVATYGASETAGGCVYDGLPLDGVEVRIGSEARIALRGPMLFERYDDDPELTAQTLVDGWFLTSDLGSLDDGRLRVLGRIDDIVISGGIKVPTPAVAARLRQHAEVLDAAVVGVPDEEWGQRVVAFVVGPLGLDAARDWVSAVHPRSWAPREVRRVDALPLLPNGKLDRQALV
ncbi:AMP-binding protein [Nocardioides sp.]|uniref:AMP-binding protein n=1 Tax=Nocardioides sp. TaxID=35761 RepID=UPI003D0D8EBB